MGSRVSRDCVPLLSSLICCCLSFRFGECDLDWGQFAVCYSENMEIIAGSSDFSIVFFFWIDIDALSCL